MMKVLIDRLLGGFSDETRNIVVISGIFLAFTFIIIYTVWGYYR